MADSIQLRNLIVSDLQSAAPSFSVPYVVDGTSVPNYELADLQTARVVVGAVSRKFDRTTRGLRTRELVVYLGVLKHLALEKSQTDREAEIDQLVTFAELLADRYSPPAGQMFRLDDFVCTEVDQAMLVDPERLRTAKLFQSGLQLNWRIHK